MLKTHKKSISLLLIVALVLSVTLVAGCQSQPATAPGDEKKAATRVITDQAGREVTLPAEVNRVVSTWRPCTFLVFAVGAQEKLVGVDAGSTNTPFTTAIHPGMANVAKVGDKRSGINLESVVAVKPDVVFLWSGKGSDILVEQLGKQGIAAVVLLPESAEQMKSATRLIGEILGHQEQAEKVLKNYDDTLAMVAQRIKDIPPAERKQVYLAGADGFLSSCGSDFYQHYLIEKAGGINVAAELKGGWQQVSAEQLVSWNPDVIVADPYCKEGVADAVKMDPGLKAIPAVKSGEMYRFPSVGQWTFPIPQSAMGVLWLSKTLYPEKFADIELTTEVDNYYQEFFGKKYSEFGEKDLVGKGIQGQSEKK